MRLLALGHLALGALVTVLEVRPNTVSLQVTETNTQNRKWGPRSRTPLDTSVPTGLLW